MKSVRLRKRQKIGIVAVSNDKAEGIFRNVKGNGAQKSKNYEYSIHSFVQNLMGKELALVAQKSAEIVQNHHCVRKAVCNQDCEKL